MSRHELNTKNTDSSHYQVQNQIVKHYAGSISYGTNIPSSDVDIRGIFCAKKQEICTPFYPVKEVTLKDQKDGKLYELHHFLGLYLKGNPNILETLWVDKEDVIEDSEIYQFLRDNAEALLSSKIAFTFSGYAFAQLDRIKGHNKWINNPQPEEPPKHCQFLKMVQNLTDNKVMPRDFNLGKLEGYGIIHFGGNIFASVETGGFTPISENGDFNISCKQAENQTEWKGLRYIFKYLPNEYKLAKEKHANYWRWRTNRNEARAETEAKFGYDTKHAMHLVRLLRMAEETLTGKGVIVKRPDAKELLDIRAGSLSYDELIKYAEETDKRIRGEIYRTTKLPKKPNLKLATNILLKCQDYFWS